MAPKVPPPAQVVKFEGRIDYPIEQVVDDWGLTPEHQEAYVELFRRKLAAAGLWRPEHDYYTIRRFLRARTYDFDRAQKMWSDHQEWRDQHKVDTLLQDFYFNERDKFLAAYPQGYHKLDKMGRPCYIQLISKINVPAVMACTDEERMFKFHVQEYERCVKVIMPIASRLANRKIDQTFGIMDVRGIGTAALSSAVRKMLTLFTKTDQDNYPEMLGHICIINAPAVFRMVWSLVKGYIDIRTQQKIEILGPNYMDTLLKHMDIDSIPEFLGGKSKGTLLDDVGPWSDPPLLASMGIDVEALRMGDLASTLPNGPYWMGSAVGGAAAPAAAGAATMARGAASFGRPEGEVDGSGFLTPQGSIALRSGSQVGASARHDGPGTHAPASQSAQLAAVQQLNTAAESRARLLMERVRALEAQVPAQLERIRANQATPTPRDGSTRAAPEGTLLNRVEVLEDALVTVMEVQEALISQLQEQQQEHTRVLADTQRRTGELEAKAAKACCCIM
ncbi:hypothetical protein HYH03_003068 [Edaphochlamys debaryana]|uniref:CRAL-TRIO domain-containing protein n=1 Tax=Edaphochlamys debaryana TaxID=47281 RepID=A0A835YDJ6_9CHLO|nr:hypothetical protein HYH03_003068 [Edaphochlamys debaryana]|eukprot:KAG2498876.1 hypothetical protein HYH03_003068 [Edaphochlamys debaryana]